MARHQYKCMIDSVKYAFLLLGTLPFHGDWSLKQQCLCQHSQHRLEGLINEFKTKKKHDKGNVLIFINLGI